MNQFLGLLFLSFSMTALAACPDPAFTAPEKVALKDDSVLIVTHATAVHDARYATKRGVDEAVEYARNRHIPVVYLQDDGPAQYYFAEDCKPDYRVFSEGGELSFEVRPARVYLVGGHLEKCLSTTVHDILLSWSRQPPRNLTLTYLMDGIYSNGKLVEESDPFRADFERFMRMVTYGRPGGEHWPKLSMLETMGIINDESQELAYLMKALPHYARTLPENYRVELQLNDSVVKVLRPAPGWHPPTLRFHFVDSALNLSNAPAMPGL